MMRRTNLFAILTAAVALTSTACTNIEDAAMLKRKMPDFSVFTNKNTRAAETGSMLKIDGKTFGVWGYSTFETVGTDVFLNQEVKHNGTTSAREYSPLRHWDMRSSYEFYAYHLYRANGVTIGDNKNIIVTDLTVEPLVANHVDLMLADKVTRLTNAPVNQIIFNFNHLLLNISLSFKKDVGITETKVTLKIVKIHGMSKKGTFVQSQVPEWTISDTDFVGASDSNLENLVDDNVLDVATTVAFNGMLFIPQNTNNVKVDVTYNLSKSGTKQPFTRALDLSCDASDRTCNPAAWGQNQKIMYSFIISANAIEFGDPIVEDWTIIIPDVEVPSIN